MDTKAPGSVQEQNNTLPNKKLYIIIGTLAVVLIAIVAITFSLLRNPQPEQALQPQDQTGTETAMGNTLPSMPAPAVSVRSWTSQVSAPAVQPTADVYNLKQNYTIAEVQQIASTLSVGDVVEEQNDAVMAYSTATPSVLVFNKKSGQYTYTSVDGIPLPAGTTVEDSVYTLLESIGMYDQSIKVTATYTKRDNPGIRYVELHRDWEEVNLPILSSIGLINTPETSKMSQLNLARGTGETSPDANITNTSDNTNGLARRTDFNSVTIGITTDSNTVTLIKSNVRILEPGKVAMSTIAYEDVLEKLRANAQNFIFTTPAGSGPIDFSMVYPNGQVSSENAVITDVAVVYVEQPPTVAQTTLEPHYVARGYMESDAGYRMNFVTTVPAINKDAAQGKSRWSLANLFNWTVNAQDGSMEDPGQKQDTLTFPTLPMDEEVPMPEVTRVISPDGCEPTAAELNPIITDATGMQVGYGPRDREDNEWEWFYINYGTATEQEIWDKAEVFYNANIDQLSQQKAGNLNEDPQGKLEFREKQAKMFKELNEDVGCPIRVTGSSPTVFVYGAAGSEYAMSVDANVTYTDPTLEGNSWTVTMGSNNAMKVNGTERSYMYYEYEPVGFTRPTAGWTVSRANIGTLAGQIAQAMQLTEAEADRLVFELNHALATVEGEEVFVGLIDRAEVDSKLPLNVSPAPASVARYHFYVSADTDGVLATPRLQPIVRTSSMVVELGAVGN